MEQRRERADLFARGEQRMQVRQIGSGDAVAQVVLEGLDGGRPWKRGAMFKARPAAGNS
ncbi:hypothetical protein [Luteimonas terrae]|uniref:hypothetical protein n=1 Tax=Luteimonas terrae TaxID=1530191 RepID=UPI000A7B05DB|nr:hypothetical protein [Luteimonas terrae]